MSSLNQTATAPDRAAPRGHRVVPGVQGGLLLVAEQPPRSLLPAEKRAGAHEGEEPQGAPQARQAHLQAHTHRLVIPGVPEVAPEQELPAKELPHRPPSLLAARLRLQVRWNYT